MQAERAGRVGAEEDIAPLRALVGSLTGKLDRMTRNSDGAAGARARVCVCVCVLFTGTEWWIECLGRIYGGRVRNGALLSSNRFFPRQLLPGALRLS